MTRAIGLGIGQNLLIQGLIDMVPEHTSAVSAAQVLAAGASGLLALAAGQADILEALRWAYSEVLRRVLILCVAAICLSFPPACCMEWLIIKTEAERRKEAINHARGVILPWQKSHAKVK